MIKIYMILWIWDLGVPFQGWLLGRILIKSMIYFCTITHSLDGRHSSIQWIYIKQMIVKKISDWIRHNTPYIDGSGESEVPSLTA